MAFHVMSFATTCKDVSWAFAGFVLEVGGFVFRVEEVHVISWKVGFGILVGLLVLLAGPSLWLAFTNNTNWGISCQVPCQILLDFVLRPLSLWEVRACSLAPMGLL